MGESTVTFNVLAQMMESISKAKKFPIKRKYFRSFLDHYYTDRQYFSVMRLILPELDRERGNYGLKESVLAKSLADALGLAKESKDAERLLNWRKGGAQSGKNAGNFALIAAEIVGSRQSQTSGELKVKQVNDMLDRLAVAKNREEKTKILAELINKTNALEMKWIIMIILKDVKLGISEKTIFKEFHPDADDVYNRTCDLKLVCDKLLDPKVRYKRQDIEVGKAVRAQLASRVPNVEAAWKKLRGKRVVAECKFDGDRCQVHKDGKDIKFFSRSSIDHKEFADAMSDLIYQHVLPDKCILDGEMVVWNRVTNRFAEFGTIQEVAKNAKDGIETDEQLCYIVFDILYVDDSSVIHQPLYERQKLIDQKVKPVKGRLELLLPDRRNCGGQLWSISAQAADEVERFFQMTVENRDEGIVLKDLESKWEPGDRSGKWLKLKPDYIHPETDLDVLIIGGYYGSGRRGGEIAQFLLGLADRPATGYPTKFLSFCKVGTGLSDEECEVLVNKLRPYFRRYDKNTRPPSYYTVTNNSKERPDVWIDQPDKSVILQISSDIRCIKSEVFATPYSLRFPRVHKVRYDKPWYDCLDVKTLLEMVENRSGNTVDVKQKKRKQEKDPSKSRAKSVPLLPPHLQQTDVSNVTKASDMFSGLIFYFANVPQDYSVERLHKLVAEYGGKFSMNLNSNVTHVIAAHKKGLIYDTAAKRGDVTHYSWFLDSIAERRILPLRPKYMLHLSNVTRETSKETIDEFGDHYFVDVDEEDMKQLFGHMQAEKLSVDEEDVLHYKRKFGRDSIFEGCFVYFHHPAQLTLDGSLFVADTVLKRLEIEVQMHKGVVKTSLCGATHMIVFLVAGSHQMAACGSLSSEQQQLLRTKKLHVLSHRWLEDALEKGNLPVEDDYNLRDIFQVTDMGDCGKQRQQPTPVKQIENIRGNDYEEASSGLADHTEAEDEMDEDQNAGSLQLSSSMDSKPTHERIDDEEQPLLVSEGPSENSQKQVAQSIKPPSDNTSSKDTVLDDMLFDLFPSLSTYSKAIPEEIPSKPVREERTFSKAIKPCSRSIPEVISNSNAASSESIGMTSKDGEADSALPAKKKSRVSYKDIIESYLN